MEEFKKIANYNYSVSNLGHVRNDVTNRILTNMIDTNGYYQVNLYKNKKMKTIQVHKLVANAFIANPDDKPCVDHINNNRLDNNINNLRWCTYTENNRNKSMKSNNSSGIKGVTFHKKSNKWCAQIMIDGINIHIGYYDTIEEATIARVQRARQAFGQYVSACEGVNHGAKQMKIRKPKKIIQPIVNQIVQPILIPDIQPIEKSTVKNDIQKIYENIVQLNDALKLEIMKL